MALLLLFSSIIFLEVNGIGDNVLMMITQMKEQQKHRRKESLQQHNREVCEDALEKFINESNNVVEKLKKKKADQEDAVTKKMKFIEDQFEADYAYTTNVLEELHKKIDEFAQRQDKISSLIAEFDSHGKDLKRELEADQEYEEDIAEDQVTEKLQQVSASIKSIMNTQPTETKTSKLLKATLSVLVD